jgi:hypothetical protein
VCKGTNKYVDITICVPPTVRRRATIKRLGAGCDVAVVGLYRWLGGCRPLHFAPLLETSSWRVTFHTAVTQVFLTSEVTVAVAEK